MTVKPKQPPKPKLTDAERHRRFRQMAREVEASEDPADFERAMDRVAPEPGTGNRPTKAD
jgi:hypothetical protein